MRAMNSPILFRLLFVAMVACLAFGAARPALANGTSADVAGIKNCMPSFSSATPAVVSCAGAAGSGFASANFNLLGARASSAGSTADVISIAEFTDQVMFSTPGSGPGFLGFTQGLNGTITGVGGGAEANVLFTVNYNDLAGCRLQFSQNAAIGRNCISMIPITFGVVNTFTIDASLTTQAKFGSAESNFSQTAEITNVGLFDANGNFIENVSLTGGSGTTYGAVPEPSGLLLLSAGLVGLAGASRRKLLP